MKWSTSLYCILAAIEAVHVGASGLSGAATHQPVRRVTHRHPGPDAALPPEPLNERLIVRQATTASATTGSDGVVSPSTTLRSGISSLPKAPASPPTSPPSPRPTPMDLQLSYAISEPCLRYLSTLLSSATFTSCLPFSLLLTTSTSFGSFVSSSAPSYDSLNALLAYVNSPQPSSEACDEYMAQAVRAMGDKGNCAADITNKVPSVISARDGLGNAPVSRQAAGLVDPDTGVYCYIQAKASGRPDDLYLWSIPAGVSVPASSTPTCSKCSQLLLGLYAQNSDDYATLNSTIINRAIGTVNSACGSGFVQYYSYSAASGSGHSATSLPPALVMLASGITTAFWAYVHS